ncbi:MAG: hypothetical protein DMF89_27025 [Acidobacteria bacterium]|nr:MAG: hypothetical protein DMF90_01365 [Acidobacteriota bacterium]PYR44749.1 MAG: hypothetical protein DMF89_27025 [Acidobacteriota bacterium]
MIAHPADVLQLPPVEFEQPLGHAHCPLLQQTVTEFPTVARHMALELPGPAGGPPFNGSQHVMPGGQIRGV